MVIKFLRRAASALTADIMVRRAINAQYNLYLLNSFDAALRNAYGALAVAGQSCGAYTQVANPQTEEAMNSTAWHAYTRGRILQIRRDQLKRELGF